MRSAAAIGRRWKNGWERAAGAALTIIPLSAVIVAGLTLLHSELLAAWKTPGNAEQALASDSAFGGLFSFDAPAHTVARVKAQTEEAEQSIQRASNASVLLKNWKFTQNPIADLLLQSLEQYLEAYEMTVANYINQVNQIAAAEFSAVASFINAVLTTYTNLVNSLLNVNTSTSINNVNSTQSSNSSHSASPFR